MGTGEAVASTAPRNLPEQLPSPTIPFMEPAVTTEPSAEPLSRAEVARRYPDRWVVLVDVEAHDGRVLGGVVYAHSRDRHALSLVVRQLLRETAVFWTGARTGVTPWLLARVDSGV